MTFPIENHPLEPFLPSDARLLFLGTFPPKQQRWSMDFYYPNRINDFWRIMGLLFHGNKNKFYDTETRSFRLNDIKQLLTDNHIAMSDSAWQIRRLRDNASDKYLEIVTPIPLTDILLKIPTCSDIAATGEKAAQTIAELLNIEVPSVGKYSSTQIEENKVIRLWRMPSTSRAYPLAIEKKAEFYAFMLHEIGII